MKFKLFMFLLLLVTVPTVSATESDWLIKISKGQVPGHSFARRFGDLETVSTSWQDIWIPGGEYVYPTTADFVNVSSTDADDTLLGNGARTLFIQGLDANYDIINEVVNMDGANNVTSTKKYLRVLRVEVRSVGVTQYNEGLISITQHDYLLGVIEIEDGKTQMALFTVPANYTAYLIDCYMTSSEDKTIEYEIAYKPQNAAWISFIEINTYREWFQHKFMAPVKFDAMTEIRTRVKAGSNSGEVGAGFVLLLVEDGYEFITEPTGNVNIESVEVDLLSQIPFIWMIFVGAGSLFTAAQKTIKNSAIRNLSFPFGFVCWIVAAYIWAIEYAGTGFFPIIWVHVIPLLLLIAWGFSDLGSNIGEKYE